MKVEYYLGQVDRLLGDPRLCGENRLVLVKFDAELETNRLKQGTRKGYAVALNRLGVWLSDKAFMDVDKDDLRQFFKELNGSLHLLRGSRRDIKGLEVTGLGSLALQDIELCRSVK